VTKAPFFDRLWYGPLLALPWQERQNLLHDIQKGRVVTDPRYRSLAFEYASTRLRRFRWFTLAVALVFIGDVAVAVAESSLHSLGPALSSLSMIFIGFVAATAWRQNRRFLLRNGGSTAMVGTQQAGP
jgi:hypothetical protein